MKAISMGTNLAAAIRAGIVLLMPCLLTGSLKAEVLTGLYNTGVAASGTLGTDTSADPHYTLVSSADKLLAVPLSAIIADSTKYPFVTDGWLPDGPFSKWIDPLADQSRGNPPGNYTYETTFRLAGGNPTGVVISGQWTLDNIGEDILINGHSTGTYYDAPGDYSFKAFQQFTLPSAYFVDGVNYLDFVVNNSDNGNGNTPTGLRVELFAQVPRQPTPIPEPSSFLLLAFGAAGLAAWQRCRRRAGA